MPPPVVSLGVRSVLLSRIVSKVRDAGLNAGRTESLVRSWKGERSFLAGGKEMERGGFVIVGDFDGECGSGNGFVRTSIAVAGRGEVPFESEASPAAGSGIASLENRRRSKVGARPCL